MSAKDKYVNHQVEIVKLIVSDVKGQLEKRKANDIVLFQIPPTINTPTGPIDIKWIHRIKTIREIIKMIKSTFKLYALEDGIRDDYHPNPYYCYSIIPPCYNFEYDKHGVYRAVMFGIMLPKSKFYDWGITGDINGDIINAYLI